MSYRPSGAAGPPIIPLIPLTSRSPRLMIRYPDEPDNHTHMEADVKGLLISTLLIGAGAAGLAFGAEDAAQTKPAAEPEHIQVQHILVSFTGKLPGKNVTRTQDEAKKLAYELLEKAKKGADFGELVKQHTDDAYPGTYGMSNVNINAGPGEYPRVGMVPAFGNVGFKLKVGEIGIADFDAKDSPYGYHIIKRLK